MCIAFLQPTTVFYDLFQMNVTVFITTLQMKSEKDAQTDKCLSLHSRHLMFAPSRCRTVRGTKQTVKGKMLILQMIILNS